MSSLGMPKPRGKRSAVYGAVTTPQGDGIPVSVELIPSQYPEDEKGGYAPTKLDPIIHTLVDNVDSGAQLLQTYTPLLAKVMQQIQEQLAATLENLTPAPLPENATEDEKRSHRLRRDMAFGSLMELAENASRILERVNKMVFQSVRAKDAATRLRAFLAGVDADTDKADGLADLSEMELRRRITLAAQGWSNGES